ncbi:MAG: hypothetical protein CVU05_00620 [Bacteroidetes bacterium HGW-Bacteroidetes-21]|jgi:hypothetical protein|nr:MAG: hypothetical protein CVU05_00620 [Bacteroidetes bacterium HGW-Bacteroidetes-21]
MAFLFPGFLFFLSLVSIPIIIHLFRFRKFRIVYFSNLRFLRDATLETRSRSKVKHLLILLCRILTVIALVMAFSQPYFPGQIKNNGEQKIISIFIDNSFSMQAPGEKGSLLEEAKNDALNIVDAFGPGTRFLVISHDFAPWSGTIISKDKAREVIPSIAPYRSSNTMDAILNRAKDIALQNKVKIGEMYLISDFQQKDILPFQLNDTNITFITLPLKATYFNNISLDSCSFDYPGHLPNNAEEMKASIHNHSGESYQNIPLQLYEKDSLISVASFSVEKDGITSQTIGFTSGKSGLVHGRIETIDHPVTYDNSLFFTYRITDKISVCCIQDKEAPPYISTFYSSDSVFRFQSFSYRQTDYGVLRQQNLIILNEATEISDGFRQEIKSFIEGGGNVLFIPSLPLNVELANSFLTDYGIVVEGSDTAKKSMYSFNEKSLVFKNSILKKTEQTRLPSVKPALLLRFGLNTQSMVSDISGRALITETSLGQGKLFTLAFPLRDMGSSFATDPLFIPFLYNIALYSQQIVPLYISNHEFVSIKDIRLSEKPVEIRNIKTGSVSIPAQTFNGKELRIFPDAGNLEPGNYDCISDQVVVGGFSINSGREESDNKLFNPGQIDSIFKSNEIKQYQLSGKEGSALTHEIQSLSEGVKLWYYFMLASLLLLLTEVLLLRKL